MQRKNRITGGRYCHTDFFFRSQGCCGFLFVSICCFLFRLFSLSKFSAFLGQLKDIVLYMMDSIPLSQVYVIFQWLSRSAPKPERLVYSVIVLRNVVFMVLICDILVQLCVLRIWRQYAPLYPVSQIHHGIKDECNIWKAWEVKDLVSVFLREVCRRSLLAT